ncbi:hypothetical protein [Streptomyces sp. NPDC058613]|uniref:hypothetical protein n=1 Tax=unclassified Streptomyces TaxID=2593676 RepID=UPI003654375B
MYPPPHTHTYGFTPAPPSRRWWQHPALIIAALVLLPPAGIVLAWTSRWSQAKKIVATVLGGLWFLLFLVSDPPEKTDDAKSVPVAAGTVTPTPQAPPSSSPAPPPTPSPSAEPRMPAVVGKEFAQAEKAVRDLGGTGLTAHSAYRDVVLPASHSDWTVCFQGLPTGSPISAGPAAPAVHLVAGGTACPAREGTDLRPRPAPEPTRTPAPPQDDSSGSGGSSSSTGGSGGSGGSGTSGGSSGSGSSGSSGSSGENDGGGAPVKRAGSFCAPAGSTAVTSAGTPLVCGPASDGRNRWRKS